MRRRALAIFCVAAAAPAFAADRVLLNANFNHETVGAAPGTGGAALGEPVANASAVVDLAPLPTPNLRIRDVSDCCAQSTVFEFLGGEEVVADTVQIRMQVWFTGSGQPTIDLRERGSSAVDFLSLYSSNNGTALYAYVGGAFQGNIGSFAAGQVLPLEIDVSAAQKLISIRLNGVTLMDRTSIALNTPRGVGTILVGHANTPELHDDVVRIDNLRAVACSSPVFADCLLVSGFDD